jgi:hypothetical protein
MNSRNAGSWEGVERKCSIDIEFLCQRETGKERKRHNPEQ